MREDMFKVIVERPRWGSRHSKPAKLRLDRMPGRKHATGRRMAMEQGYTRGLNENLAPLKRYLHKQVGRKWDQVFSEICQHLDTGHTVKMHVREHIDDFIVTKVTVDRKGRWIGAGRRWGAYSEPQDWFAELYVDPYDGVIKRTADLCRARGEVSVRDRWKQRRSAKGFVHLIRKRTETDYVVKLGGLWFAITLDKPPRLGNGALYEDIKAGSWRAHGRWAVTGKHQLGRKALRELGLQNGRDAEETGA